jgi:transcription initiation factor TFIID subunit TAF12
MDPVHQPILSKQKLRELSHTACPGEKMDQSVEGILVKIAEDFVSKVAQSSAELTRHRKSKILEVDDVQLHLGTGWM